MSFSDDETSIDSANPIELYKFSYNNANYCYTTLDVTISKTIDDDNYTFLPNYIKRGDSLKLGDSSSSIETCTVTVDRDNPVALLYKGTPPELGAVRLNVYRVHGKLSSDCILIIRGIVSQVHFKDSEAELTITIESILNREIPRGKLSYFCQNCIYDVKCGLELNNYGMLCYLEDGAETLRLYSKNLTDKASGYFTNGFIRIGNSYRSVVLHKGDFITIKYPLPLDDRKETTFMIYPGCDNLFQTCAEKFNNTDNFSGVPYIEPYNAFTNPTGKGAYWVNSDVIFRDTKGKINDG